MDQKSLYELQTGYGKFIQTNNEPALVVRDRYIIDYITDHVKLQQQLKVAELSIGEGRLSKSLLQFFPNLRLSCVDISPTRIEFVKTLLASQIDYDGSIVKFIKCDFDTEFDVLKNEAYDFAIALDIMEHVLDVFGFVDNCNRILRENGVLFLRVPNIAYVKHRLRLLQGKLPITASWFGNPEDLSAWRQQYGWDGGHLHLFTVPILRVLLEEGGFQIESCRDPGARFQGLRNMLPNLLYANPLIVARKKSG